MFEFKRYDTAAKFTRKLLGVARLSSAQKKEVEAAVARHNDRQSRKNVGYVEYGIDRLKRRIEAEIKPIVEDLVLDTFRTSSTGWAGGNNNVRVFVSKETNSHANSYTVWSSNRKWSGTDVEFRIKVCSNWRKVVWSSGLALAGGMLTTHAERVSEDCWRATWLEQGKGYSIKPVSGYIVRVGDQYFHGKTEASARSVYKRRQKALQQRGDRAEFLKQLKGLSASELMRRYGDLKIKRSDSIRYGNCSSGTAHWIERYFPGVDVSTVAAVLSVDDSEELLGAVRCAIVRQTKKQPSLV